MEWNWEHRCEWSGGQYNNVIKLQVLSHCCEISCVKWGGSETV